MSARTKCILSGFVKPSVHFFFAQILYLCDTPLMDSNFQAVELLQAQLIGLEVKHVATMELIARTRQQLADAINESPDRTPPSSRVPARAARKRTAAPAVKTDGRHRPSPMKGRQVSEAARAKMRLAQQKRWQTQRTAAPGRLAEHVNGAAAEPSVVNAALDNPLFVEQPVA